MITRRVAVGAALAIVLGLALPGNARLEWLTASLLLPALLLQMLGLGFAVRDVLSERPRQPPAIGGRFSLGLILLMGVAAVAMRSLPAHFLVLADEGLLANTAMSLYHRGSPNLMMESMAHHGSFTAMQDALPARPLLFPALVAASHCILGYVATNSFAVNWLAALLAVGMTVWICRGLYGEAVGLLAGTLLLSSPLFLTCSRSGGFETVNLLLLAAIFAAMLQFTRRPTAATASALVWTALLGLQCRYETGLMLLPVAALLLLFRRQVVGTPRPWLEFLAPLTVVPSLWQRRLVSVADLNLQGHEAAGLAYLRPHLAAAWRFFVVDSYHPVAPWLFMFSLIGAVAGLWRLSVKIKKLDTQAIATAAFTAGSGLLFFSHMFWFFGDLTDVPASRFALSYLLPLCVGAAFALNLLWQRSELRFVIVFGAMVNLLWGFSAAANDDGRRLAQSREFEENDRFLRDYSPVSTLIISSSPNLYALDRFSSIFAATANDHSESIQRDLDRHWLANVFVIQHLSDQGGATPPLSPKFALTTVREYRIAADFSVRISRVSSIANGGL